MGEGIGADLNGNVGSKADEYNEELGRWGYGLRNEMKKERVSQILHDKTI